MTGTAIRTGTGTARRGAPAGLRRLGASLTCAALGCLACCGGAAAAPAWLVTDPLSAEGSPAQALHPDAASWSFGDGQSATDEQVSHTYAAPGTYTVSVTSTDTLGNPTTTARQITIGSQTTITPTTPSTTPRPAALTLTHVSESHRRWREGTGAARLARHRRAAAPPVGTQFGFVVSQAARVTFTFARTTAGRRVAGRCQAPSGRNRRRPRCTRARRLATLSYSVTAGRHRLAFAGRAGRRLLPAGAYELTLTASSPGTGQRASAPALGFTIVRSTG